MKKIFNILFLLLGINLYSQQVVELCPDSKTIFTYSSNAGVNGTYTWFVNNDSYVGNQLTLEWSEEGIYVLNLYFISNSGCEDTISYIVNVKLCEDVSLFIPNSFTPNDDGLNDLFQVKGINFEKFDLSIFNRWGELIYQTNDPLSGWNGKYKNAECQQDVYVYVIRYYNLKNKVFQRVGHITLIR